MLLDYAAKNPAVKTHGLDLGEPSPAMIYHRRINFPPPVIRSGAKTHYHGIWQGRGDSVGQANTT